MAVLSRLRRKEEALDRLLTVALEVVGEPALLYASRCELGAFGTVLPWFTTSSFPPLR